MRAITTAPRYLNMSFLDKVETRGMVSGLVLSKHAARFTLLSEYGIYPGSWLMQANPACEVLVQIGKLVEKVPISRTSSKELHSSTRS